MRGTGAGMLLKILIWGCLCQVYASDMCLRDPCKNNGLCKPFGDDGYVCSCQHGWTGKNCSQNFNDCYPNPCHNGGQCIDRENTKYFCKCTSQYIGTNCQHQNPCLKHYCKNGGTCISLLDGTASCRCSSNFKGSLCESRVFSCPKDSERNRAKCNNHGQCQYDEDGKPFCKCDSNYRGDNCEKKSLDIGCNDDFCLNGGVCTKLINGDPACKCTTGYRGRKCEDRDGNLHEAQKRKNSEEVESQTVKTKRNMSSQNLPASTCNIECEKLRGNGICDQGCNTATCHYDGGDCDPWKKCTNDNVAHCRYVFRNKKCNPECNNVDCLFDGQDCERSPCINKEKCSKVYQNGICNDDCNNPQCGFDGGDCQGKQSDSFFSNVNSLQQCTSNTKEFELDLILLTTKDNFLKNQSTFLQSLGSALKMVLTVSKITEIKFNSTSALSIKLKINPSECVIYGGQCFSSLEQISNFINAGMSGRRALSLPFKVAKVDSMTVYTKISNIPNGELKTYFIAVISMCFALTISIIVIGVLLRDKWGRLRTKVKTAGVWTPSEGYSTSTSSINSNNKSGWPVLLQPHHVKLENRPYGNELSIFDAMKQSRLEKEFDGIPDVWNRKRKYDVVDEKALAFQTISENLEKRDGVNPVGPTQAKLLSLINENLQTKTDQRYGPLVEENADIGAYVTDVGESLLHVASRMNCGPNIIKKLHNISPGMLHSTDEWGRTPLATAVASDSYESVEPLLLLEKQSRKESKQHKSRSCQNSFTTCGTVDSPVKKTTGLIESVKLNSQEMINLLLDEGSPVNVLDSGGRSVVHWAAIFDNVALLERLSHMKIFQKLVDLKDNEEKSPLYLAANEGSLDAAKFIVGYITRLGIKIDPIYPCPETNAAEKGFTAIETLIRTAQLPGVYSEKAYKRMKLKDQKLLKKSTNSSNSPQRQFGNINEYQEYSIKLDKNSPSGLDSIDSCLLDMYSLKDATFISNIDSCTNERNNYSSFKPHDNNCHSYPSNTSSSDMSPPLLNLNHPSIQNGYHYHSDRLDSTLPKPFFDEQ